MREYYKVYISTAVIKMTKMAPNHTRSMNIQTHLQFQKQNCRYLKKISLLVILEIANHASLVLVNAG